MARRGLVFLLDASLLLALLVLLSPHITGLPVHEWLGLAVCAPVLVHLLLSWRWIVTSTRRFLNGPGLRTRVNYLLNATFFVLFVLAIVSGLAVSRVALPAAGIRLLEDRSWRTLHNGSCNFMLLAIALHLAMNWTWVRATVGKLRARSGGIRLGAARLRAGELVRRSGVLLALAAAIALAAFLWLGAPSPARRFPFDELRNYATARPLMARRHLEVETAFVLGFALIARVVLRVRLEAGGRTGRTVSARSWRPAAWLARRRARRSDDAPRLQDPAA